jgi:superoxide dismutase
MKIELAPLPYAYTALEPKIGKQTLEIHHDKHHAKYVNVANQMIEGTEMEKDDCATIVVKAHKAGNQVILLSPLNTCVWVLETLFTHSWWSILDTRTNAHSLSPTLKHKGSV